MPNASLVVAVGSSNRPENLRNPWTHSERSEMIYRWLESSSIRDSPIIVPIPDIDDPPNWVSHAELYHGGLGFSYQVMHHSIELYEDSNWNTIEVPMEERERLEGWRVRETARMMSTIDDLRAVREVLTPTIPESVISLMTENNISGDLHLWERAVSQ